jgi:DNA recombination protein RmuC
MNALGYVLCLVLGLAAGATVVWLARRGTAQSPAPSRDAFQALAAEALRSNNQQFLDLAKAALEKFQEGARGDLEKRQQAIDQLVKPVGATLEKFDSKLSQLEKSRSAAEAALSTQLQGLARSEADLVNALRAPEVRGAWGELVLRQVVEYAGMTERCNFTAQTSVATDDGSLRPDLVVNLPGGTCVVVDAKTPLKAHLAAMAATDEASRERHLDEFVRLVRVQVDKLGQKSYQKEFNTPDFVVLFLPGESFFSTVLRRDPTLLEYMHDKKVLLASPLTLISLLKTVAYGWLQTELAKNASEISEAGQELYKRLNTFAGNLGALGSRLDKAVEDYNDVIGSLERNILPSTRKLKDLGAAPAGDEIVTPTPLENRARTIQKPELLPPSKN